MKILRLLYLSIRIADRKWALREINPLHPDVPRLVHDKRHLEEEFRRTLLTR